MSIQKINVGGQDVEIEDASARTNITNINNTIGSETLQTTSKTLKGAINEVKQSIGGSGGGGGSDWVEITSDNKLQAEITQKFSEIRLLAKSLTVNVNYSVTYNYDSTIFHNNISKLPTYMICGNPMAHNYGCKFQYAVTTTGQQYVSVDSCYSGGGNDAIEFRAWIKPVPNGPQ